VSSLYPLAYSCVFYSGSMTVVGRDLSHLSGFLVLPVLCAFLLGDPFMRTARQEINARGLSARHAEPGHQHSLSGQPDCMPSIIPLSPLVAAVKFD